MRCRLLDLVANEVAKSREKRGRKPGMSLNGDRIVESMRGIVAEAVSGAVWKLWKEGKNV